MSKTKEDKYVELMDVLQVGSERMLPSLDNIRWFIRIGYKHNAHKSSALAALDMAYSLQTKWLKQKAQRPSATWADTDEDLQNSLKR